MRLVVGSNTTVIQLKLHTNSDYLMLNFDLHLFIHVYFHIAEQLYRSRTGFSDFGVVSQSEVNVPREIGTCIYLLEGQKISVPISREYVRSIPAEESDTPENKANGSYPAEEFGGGVSDDKLIRWFVRNYHRTRQALAQ